MEQPIKHEFNWVDDDDDNVVIAPVRAIAIYENCDGDVEIRQQGPFGEEDAIIVIPRGRAKAFLAGLRNCVRYLGKPSGGD